MHAIKVRATRQSALKLVSASNRRQRGLSAASQLTASSAACPGHQSSIEKRWREFFLDPAQWWDHRLDKKSGSYPDFRHKKTQQGLWVAKKSNPKWVQAEVAAMAPGTVSRNPFSWNINLTKCVKDGQYEKAFNLYKEMQRDGVQPDLYTFIPVLTACASLGALQEGKSIHAQILQNSCESDIFVATSLLHMYAKLESLEDAQSVFNKMPTRTVVSWNALIGGYVKCGQCQRALELFHQMQAEEMEADSVTFVAILRACASTADLLEGRRVHAQIIRSGHQANMYVGSSLVDMYSKCGSLEEAWGAFANLPTRDLVSWNTMIGGYAKCGQGEKALELYKQMQAEQVQPDPVTFVAVLNACASVVALGQGRDIHAHIVHRGCQENLFVRNALIDMYAKCGSIEDALRVFYEMLPICQDLVAWNTILGGCAAHGEGITACQLFEHMCRGRVEPNRVTFVCLLSACSHGGLVHEGIIHYESMSESLGLVATDDHNACIVDLLGRAGRLHEAEEMIYRMSWEPQVVVWHALLSACRMHDNVKMGERIAKRVLETDPNSSTGYVLLSNIYSSGGNLSEPLNGSEHSLT